MGRFILAAVAALGLSEAAPARAQFGFGHGHHFGYDGFGCSPPGLGFGHSYRGGFGLAVGAPHFRLGGFSGGFATRSVFLPPAFVGPFDFAPPFAFNPFGFGFGSPFFGAYALPVVAVPIPVPAGAAEALAGPEPLPLPAPEERALFPKGDFLVITPNPQQRGKAPRVPPDRPAAIPDAGKVTKVERPPRPPGPVIGFDPFKPRAKVAAEVAEADPKREAGRLVKLGRESFAAGDYGRAAEHFGRAAAADPGEARAYFLHAQAQFAAGQFAEAVAGIRRGLARDPKWPGSGFDPKELYGDKPERFVLHLLALKKALAENPDEATLEFLLGYELWFGGDRAEARRLFGAAAKRLPASGPIALFK